MINIIEKLGNIDIYLLDQIMKERYIEGQIILDAGCGSGRNMQWFYDNDFVLYAIDVNQENITYVQEKYPSQKDNYQVASIANLPYEDNSIDHIVNNAVLHFSESTEVFMRYFSELVRVLKPGGSLFIRMTSDVGIEHNSKHLQDGVYSLGDGTDRFLLSRKLLKQLLNQFPIALLEPFKSTNVADLRVMSTLVLTKER